MKSQYIQLRRKMWGEMKMFVTRIFSISFNDFQDIFRHSSYIIHTICNYFHKMPDLLAKGQTASEKQKKMVSGFSPFPTVFSERFWLLVKGLNRSGTKNKEQRQRDVFCVKPRLHRNGISCEYTRIFQIGWIREHSVLPPRMGEN